MIAGYLVLGSILLCVVVIDAVRRPYGWRTSARVAVRGLAAPLVRVAAAITASSLLIQLVPQQWFVYYLGGSSGGAGIVLASALGALMPGGPSVAFPVAVAMFRAGVGLPQMVALQTGWCLFAAHRMVSFELPMLGWRFVSRRLLVSVALAPLAGAAAALLVSLR